MSDTVSRSAVRAMPIVGATYRPPAPAILASLPAGTVLGLRPEPANPYDPNAVMVVITVAQIEDYADPDILASGLAGFGMSVEDVIDSPKEHEFHLGYIAKTYAALLAPMMQGTVWPAQLQFSASGQPMAKPIAEDC